MGEGITFIAPVTEAGLIKDIPSPSLSVRVPDRLIPWLSSALPALKNRVVSGELARAVVLHGIASLHVNRLPHHHMEAAGVEMATFPPALNQSSLAGVSPFQ